MAAHQLNLSLPAAPTAVTTARHRAVDAIAEWDVVLDDDVVHTAALVVSELVTNAVRHTATGQVSLHVRILESALRIEVCDSSPALPAHRDPDGHSESGRGLFLVAALAERCGAEPTPVGKRCWAEIAVPAAAPAPGIAVSLPL
ncbi:ATP-binding protein [Streptomyces aquilus]|uniref:ATP-binding protein n=1 Tax=Streptomyces aquilus TaxID=2548456 RepID=A0A3S9IEY6_9ACTN|nr:ATP-binding protein [Streptomyces aquilus]AZP22885.1 ATP-binding protein [Streptomyces aquilus]